MSNERQVKILSDADGAAMECDVINDLITERYNGEAVNLDDILALIKRAQDHLKSLRANVKREIMECEQ